MIISPSFIFTGIQWEVANPEANVDKGNCCKGGGLTVDAQIQAMGKLKGHNGATKKEFTGE